MILHPGHRKKWIKRRFKRERADGIISTFKAFYHNQYHGVKVTKRPQPERSRPETSILVNHDYYNTPEDVNAIDELEIYLQGPVFEVKQPLAWWREHQTKYPRLSIITFDILSIPAMSAKCERSFSQAKLALSIQRQSLTDDTMNMLLCLQSWLRN